MSDRKKPAGSRRNEKKRILRAVAALARKLGHTPSILEFAAHAEISRYSLFRLFPKWNKAVRAAGLQPNRLHVRPEDDDLLRDWGETVRKKRAIPSPWAYRLSGKYFPLTLAKRFGGWDSVPQTFRKFARGNREWADVLEFLPAPRPKQECGRTKKHASCPNPSGKTHRSAFKDRPTYGNPLPSPEFRHEPVNEQGVVLLFGMLAKDLGYMIEAVQKEFPDCEAKRQIGPDRWQRVRIEFEYESRNFREHGHSLTGCDVIVCWRHNWDDCPKHIEVLELSSVIETMAKSEG
jgi:hypothetical protein